MDDVFDQLFSSGAFMPHGHCYLWTPALVWLQVIANGLTGLAYLWISGTLLHIIRRIKDLPFDRVFIAFGIFIVSCGVTHFMDVVTIWRPVYWLDGAIRAVTAIASVGTGVLMVPLIPRVLALSETSRLAHERGLALEQVNAELAALMDRTKARYHEVLAESLPTIVWVTRADGEVEYFNKRWYEYTGQDPGVLEGQGWGWLPVVDPAQRDATEARFKQCLESGEPYEVEYRLRSAGGDYRWHIARGLPFRDEAGAISRWFGTCTDIDAEKRATEEREATVAELERTLRIREEFLSVASHELRTPVTTLGLQAEGLLRILDRDSLDTARLRAGAKQVERQAGRLERLVSDLLDVSRLTGGRMQLQKEELDLAELFREVVAPFDAASVTIGEVISHKVRTDRSRLHQVLENLVTNAVKFGNGERIVISASESDGRARIRVQDRGIGIAPADHERIFERFERAVSDRNYGGLGLGLWISREIMTALGGTITVESTPGEGATFTVELPLREPAA
jgi:PAS domain S-box-containing protein